MYKILVVDDEPVVSLGIKEYLLQSELGISQVETAVNGFEALDCLRLDDFDLVLTDIQMSKMNGIELMEAILMEQPQLPIIVISAHEIFDFAQQSLRLGAKDYLVKPVELEQLIRVVGQALQERTIKRERLRRESQATGDWHDALRTRDLTLLEVVTDPQLSDSDIAWMLSPIDIELIGPCYSVMCVFTDLSSGGFSDKGVTIHDRRLLKYASLNVLEESLGQWRSVAFYGLGNQLIVIIQLDEGEVSDTRLNIKSRLNLLGNTLYMNLKTYLNVEATIGISSQQAGASSMARLMKEAAEAADWRRLHPDHAIFFYEDRVNPMQLIYSDWLTEVDGVIGLMKSGEGGGARFRGLTERLAGMRHARERFDNCFGLLTYRLFGLLLELGQDSGVPLGRLEPHDYFRDRSPEVRLELLAGYMDEVSTAAAHCLALRDRTIIHAARDYIRLHYGNRGLKLQDIASQVHISPTYLSYLFKRIMGQNLWDYLTEVRLEAAKRLLADTHKKRYEIAFEIGYESPEHFSRVFKKHVGVSPAEYRAR